MTFVSIFDADDLLGSRSRIAFDNDVELFRFVCYSNRTPTRTLREGNLDNKVILAGFSWSTGDGTVFS